MKKTQGHKDYIRVKPGIYKRGNTFTIAYCVNGKPRKEATGFTSVQMAEKLLQKRKGEAVDGKLPSLRTQKTTFDELADALIQQKRIDKIRSLDRVIYAVRRLERKFGGMKAKSINTDHINEYILERQREGRQNATINNELSALRQMFALGFESQPKKVDAPLKIKKLPTENIREGFIEYEEYLRIKEALPEYLKGVWMLGYFSGMRRGEITSIELSQVNWAERKLYLKRSQVKTKEPRVYYVKNRELWEIMLLQKRMAETVYKDCKYLFFRDGKKIHCFRTAFDEALIQANGSIHFVCNDCGKSFDLAISASRRKKQCNPCPHCKSLRVKRDDMLFHDLRRTGVRNLIRSGISQKVAMLISGHKTDEIFRRYHIIDEADIEKACELVELRHASQIVREPERRFGKLHGIN